MGEASDLLLAEALVAAPRAKDAWRDGELAELARRFWVSEEVVVRRLLAIGKVSDGFYRKKRRELAVRASAATEESGAVPVHRRVMVAAGRPYIGIVLDALHRDVITLSDVSDYLDMKVTHLPKLELELRATPGREAAS